MEKELFEQIVMSVCKSEDKTNQVMDIVYDKTKYLKCKNNHFFADTYEYCPYCENTLDKIFGYIKKCQNKHYYRKELSKCPYCEPIVESVTEPKEVSKKQELIDSLDYLKKKEHKTDKDKESISIIQAILNGMK
jgi:hypothetical protein